MEFYRKSLEKYDRAYQIRSGYYPGINKATLLLMLGSLKAGQTGQAPGSIKELFESEELAVQASHEPNVLESRPPR